MDVTASIKNGYVGVPTGLGNFFKMSRALLVNLVFTDRSSVKHERTVGISILKNDAFNSLVLGPIDS